MCSYREMKGPWKTAHLRLIQMHLVVNNQLVNDKSLRTSSTLATVCLEKHWQSQPAVCVANKDLKCSRYSWFSCYIQFTCTHRTILYFFYYLIYDVLLFVASHKQDVLCSENFSWAFSLLALFFCTDTNCTSSLPVRQHQQVWRCLCDPHHGSPAEPAAPQRDGSGGSCW